MPNVKTFFILWSLFMRVLLQGFQTVLIWKRKKCVQIFNMGITKRSRWRHRKKFIQKSYTLKNFAQSNKSQKLYFPISFSLIWNFFRMNYFHFFSYLHFFKTLKETAHDTAQKTGKNIFLIVSKKYKFCNHQWPTYSRTTKLLKSL